MKYWLEILAAAALTPLVAYVVRAAVRFIRSRRLTLDLPYPLPETLTRGGRVGLLYVRDCAQDDGLGPVRNRVIWFRRGAAGSWSAKVVFPKDSGFVFKCFIDKPPMAFEEAARILQEVGYRDPSRSSAPHQRIWFLLPDPYMISPEPGGFTNNLILPQ